MQPGIENKQLLYTPGVLRLIRTYEKMQQEGELKKYGSDFIIMEGGAVVMHGPSETDLVSDYKELSPASDWLVRKADGQYERIEA